MNCSWKSSKDLAQLAMLLIKVDIKQLCVINDDNLVSSNRFYHVLPCNETVDLTELFESWKRVPRDLWPVPTCWLQDSDIFEHSAVESEVQSLCF